MSTLVDSPKIGEELAVVNEAVCLPRLVLDDHPTETSSGLLYRNRCIMEDELGTEYKSYYYASNKSITDDVVGHKATAWLTQPETATNAHTCQSLAGLGISWLL